MKGRLAGQLREAIRETGIGVVEFADRAGIDGGQLSRFMTGKRTLKLPAVESLCEALGLEFQPIRPAKGKGK
jgi:hypothetical protein